MFSAALIAFIYLCSFAVGVQPNGSIVQASKSLNRRLSKRQSFSEFGGKFDRSEFSNACSIPITTAQYRYRIIDPCPLFSPISANNRNKPEIITGTCSRDTIKNTCKGPYFLIEFNLDYGFNSADLTLVMAQDDYPSNSYNLMAAYGLQGMSGISVNNGENNELIVDGDIPFSNSSPKRPAGGVVYDKDTKFFFAYTENGVTIGYNDAIIAQSKDLTVIDNVFEGGNITMRFARHYNNEYEISNFQIFCLNSEEPCGISTTSDIVTSITTSTGISTTTEKMTETSTSTIITTSITTTKITSVSTLLIPTILTTTNIVTETQI